MGVSRTVIREAMCVLSGHGLVKVRPGGRTYAQELSAKDATASIEVFPKLRHTPESFRDIYEVRCVVKVEAAGLAVQRATEEDLAALAFALESVVLHQGDATRGVDGDLAFHASLAFAARNELLGVHFGPVSGRLEELVARLTGEPWPDRCPAADGKYINRSIRAFCMEQIKEID